MTQDQCLAEAAELELMALKPMPDDARAHILHMAVTWRSLADQKIYLRELAGHLTPDA